MQSTLSTAQISCSSWPSAGLVLLAPGGLPAEATPLMAALLAAEPSAVLPVAAGDPHALLAQLLRVQPGWLLPLANDPAADLRDRGCWAEVLGAWRQPAVMLVSPEQAAAGPARAYTALMQMMNVPLVGVVQLGLPWLPDQRRGDTVPWLGALELDRAEAPEAARVRQVLFARWRLIAARNAPPAGPAL